MYPCPNCASKNVIKKGKDLNKYGLQQRFKCKDCNSNFYKNLSTTTEITKISSNKSSNKTWVVTSVLNDTSINEKFLNTLESYCDHNDAELMIIPIQHNREDIDITYDDSILDYLLYDNTELTKDLLLYAGVYIAPYAANPLASVESYSQGKSIIFGSPQLMMKTFAVNHVDKSVIAYTTGSISEPNYSNTKSGGKATINHSYSALVIEEDTEINSFHIRVLNSDDSGEFYDIDKFYSGSIVIPSNKIPAIVLGDEHVAFVDKTVVNATFHAKDSICNILNPEYLIRHDILDFYSGSHHHKNDFFTQYKKYVTGTSVVEDELTLTLDYILETTVKKSKSVIIQSNHNSHLDTWLNSADIKREPWNAKLYHYLMYLKLRAIESHDDSCAFEIWCRSQTDTDNLIFVADESFKIYDIELGIHGHAGTNGSKGSSTQFAKLGTKTISAHHHSPQITNGNYIVGTSSELKLDYNKGPSSWNHAHCIIQPNGKRQMIFINSGKWRR